MPEITFVFGPSDSFFFDCPKAWKFHGIPHSLRQLFNSSMQPTWRIAQPYCVALAPGVKSFKSSEPLWYAGCRTLSGEDKLFYTQNSFETTYPDLTRWIKNLNNAPPSCFITFGQNLSYFACASGQGSIWGGIPSELEAKVRQALDTPLCVGLGKHNAWVVLYSDGYIAWKFHGHYSALDKILNEAAPRSVAYVAISPYCKEHYFIAFRDRSIKYNFKGAPKEWMTLMTDVFNSWAGEPLEKQPLPPGFTQSHPRAEQRYYVQQQYPQGQAWQQQQPRPPPQHSYQQAQSAYNYNSPSHLPAQLANNPAIPGMPSPAVSYSNPIPSPAISYASPALGTASPAIPHTSPVPGMASPAISYTSPVPQNAMPHAPYGYGPPQGGAVEMLAELPGDTMVVAPVPASPPSMSTDVSSSSHALLARDLWSADSKLEEEKVSL